MVIRIEDLAGLVVFEFDPVADFSDFSSHTSALSFHDMPASSQSFRREGLRLGRRLRLLRRDFADIGGFVPRPSRRGFAIRSRQRLRQGVFGKGLACTD